MEARQELLRVQLFLTSESSAPFSVRIHQLAWLAIPKDSDIHTAKHAPANNQGTHSQTAIRLIRKHINHGHNLVKASYMADLV